MVLSLRISGNFQKLAQLSIIGLTHLIFYDWSITSVELISNERL